MAEDLNPQAAQMADESMVRNLAAQAEAIWPQERRLFERYGLGGAMHILDAGCGTGEISLRLAELYSEASVLGVDIIPEHLARARARCAAAGQRARFEERSVYALGLDAGTFDLVVCRHVIHSIPHPEAVLAELARVTRPGGRIHVIAEDYGMIQFPPRTLDPGDVWPAVPRVFGAATGTDLFVGRRAFTLLRRLGLRDVGVDYVVLDTLRVPRETFAAIFGAWRDGYAGAVGEQTPMSAELFTAHMDDMIATMRDPDGYGVWFVPVVSGVVG